MSHQKTKPIESPLKPFVHSMLLENHQQTIFSSRITQKRKPIFDDTLPRSSLSRSNSLRKKIFSKTQKSHQQNSSIRFSKHFQAQQLEKRQGENYHANQISQSILNSSSQSSSIQQDSGLGEVKKQLFPETPAKRIKKQKDELEDGRQWLTNSNKGRNRKLFEGSMSPPKSNISVSTNNIDKTALKFSYQTPQKKKQQQIQDKSYQRTQFNSESKPSSFIRNLYTEPAVKNQTPQKEPEKDIAKQIRDLHSKMLQKTKVCSNIDEKNRSLKQQNERLREQNKMLKSHQLRLSIRPEENVHVQESMEERSKDELMKMANECIYVKVKVQKAKKMLKNLLQISETEQLPQNSIINLEQTLKQVLKELQI